LRDCVTSLEKHTLSDVTFNEVDNKEPKVISILSDFESFRYCNFTWPGSTSDMIKIPSINCLIILWGL
jgi:hypothetical protein